MSRMHFLSLSVSLHLAAYEIGCEEESLKTKRVDNFGINVWIKLFRKNRKIMEIFNQIQEKM